jgi:DHA3 family macrolide efflux protein-like MFS transporter
MEGIMMIDVGTAAVAVAPLFFIAIPQPASRVVPETQDGKDGVWLDIRAGFRYVWGWSGLTLVMIMATLINLMLTPASSLTPILVSKHFGGGAFELAWTQAAFGVGVILGGLILSAWGGFKRRVLTSLAGLLVLGGAMAAIGFIPAAGFWIAVGMYFLTGFANPIVNGPLFAVVQAVVAPDMQGRVFTLMISVASAMSPLGLIVAGPIADLTGVQNWYVIGGSVTLIIGIMAFFTPAILNIEEDRQPDGDLQVVTEPTTPQPLECTD